MSEEVAGDSYQLLSLSNFFMFSFPQILQLYLTYELKFNKISGICVFCSLDVEWTVDTLTGRDGIHQVDGY